MERWQIKRIGFVNFWYYDDECFEFGDGKLLLRGQNGSGKSITTQSFIPFILDGDRSASRLDPFGSRDRKMEYYFLLDDAKDESTGYLYLEFYKEDTDEYRTIGIGQRFKRGSSSQGFWGFIILDNRRIGVDINLYRESGGKNIPFDKNELKKILGEDNILVEENRKYKEYVNKYLFGFERLDQYEQFVDLLIQVRAPKLSKEFTPNKVIDILKNSLQVLADEDLRAMVDAMEKMDEIEDKLEELKRAFSASKNINNVYDTYNRHLLALKYRNYLNKKEQTNDIEKKYSECFNSINALKEELNKLENDKLNAEATLKQVQDKISQYLDPELENIDRKLSMLRNSLRDFNKQLTAKEEQYQNKQANKRNNTNQLNIINSDIESLSLSINNKITDLENLNESLKLEFENEIINFIKEENGLSKDLLFSRIRELKSSLSDAEKALSELEKAKEALNFAIQESDDNKVQINKKINESDDKEISIRDKKDEIINFVDNLQNNNYWIVDAGTIQSAIGLVSDYESKDLYKFKDIFKKSYDEQQYSVTIKKANLTSKLETLNEALSFKQKEYEDIETYEDIEPIRDENAIKAREFLSSLGIKALPFYKTIKFSNEISEERKAVIEQALVKTGLLDALVVSKKDYQLIKEKYTDLNDVLIYAENVYENITCKELLMEDNLDENIQETVNKILSNFGTTFRIDDNSNFYHGLLNGCVVKEKSEYIGVLARKLKKEELLKKKKKEIDDLLDQIRTHNTLIREQNIYIESMNQEYYTIPDLFDLDSLVNELKNIENEIKLLSKKQEEIDKNVLILERKKNELNNKAIDICKPLNYGYNLENIKKIIQELDEYKDIFLDCTNIKSDITNKKENVIFIENVLENVEVDLDTLYRELKELKLKIESTNQEILSSEEYLQNPETKDKIKILSSLKLEEESLNRKINKLTVDITLTNTDIENHSQSIIDLKNKLSTLKIEEENYHSYFLEEANLKFVLKGDEDIYLQADKFLKGYGDKKMPANMEKNVQDVYSKYSGDLVNYQTGIEELFGDDDIDEHNRYRLIIVAFYSGQKLHLNNFIDQIENKILETEELIQQRDRELFEDILSQTISQKLTRKIDESRTFIKEMSNLMKDLKTSMGLNFSLDWTPVQNEDGTIGIKELERILTTDKSLISSEDEMAVARYFRKRIQAKKQEAIDNEETINYLDLVKNVLDYRDWFVLKIKYQRSGGNRNDLTNGIFNKFSGGEKAMAMYIPLFASVNAQLKKAKNLNHPRLIALDEAFAGIDETNIESLFKLVDDLDFDYIMNSQILWGCYKSVNKLKIVELLRPNNSNVVTTITYDWNGKEKRLLS